MITEIKKIDIPDWQYGDVAVKTYSYGELLSIKDMATFSGEDIIPKEGFRESDVGIMVVAAGIHFIRTVDGADFVIKPNSDIDVKKKFCYNLDTAASFKLLREINKINTPITEQEKK